MGIEALIYCYGAVCVSMIAFNCICILIFKTRNWNIHKKSRSLDGRIAEQTARIARGEAVQRQHLAYLNRRLAQVGNLMAFDVSLETLFERDKETAERYLREIHGVLIYLAVKYYKKETMQCAYYAHFLAKYKICRYAKQDVIMELLQDYLTKDSLYCRLNAMKALYSSGSEETVVEGISVLDTQNTFFHSKILADGLLTFVGDHARLIELLWQSFESFTIPTQVSILNYIRFQSGAYCRQMFELLTDESRNCELHFAAIRYFGKYPYSPAYRVCLKFAGDTDPMRWNYAAFSASSLASYPGEETVRVLKRALCSSNWYIRYNAAQSLEALGLSYNDLIDVLNGNDRYAREMILYRFDNRNLKEKKQGKEMTASV